MIVVDTSVIYALLDGRDTSHRTVADWYGSCAEELALTPMVLAEVDHLAGARAGVHARRAFRAVVSAGVYAVEWWRSAATESAQIAERYADTGVDLTDASLVALADRLETVDIATLDARHFRAIAPLSGAPAFRLLPADA